MPEWLLKLLDTIFNGGIFLAVLGIAWRGARFVERVDGKLTMFAEKFEKNDNDHDRLHERLDELNRNGRYVRNGRDG